MWLRTLILPSISFLTGLKATEPRTSKRVVRLSHASRNSLVEMALSLFLSRGTSVKLRFSVSKYVPPVGTVGADAAMIVVLRKG
jgi:hypothetical protein